jgi:outer membrane protein assembly factor BamA
MTRLIGAAVLALAIAGAEADAQVAEVLREVRVHGNHTTPDADVLAIAGLTVGAPVTDSTLQEATDRLRRSGRFDDVDVRKRFRSLDDPSDILVIVLVDEVTGITDLDLTPGPLKKMRSLGMWLPLVDYADGYGFTYGARVTFVEAFGKRSRISVPLTWGGERKAAVEVDRSFQRGPLSRIETAVAIHRRVNPHFEIADTRKELLGRAERALTPRLRVGGGATLTNVRFGSTDETYVIPGLDVTLDTRADPAFPRNAVHVIARAEQLRFDSSTRIARWTTDARGFVGLFGSAVLALRGLSIRAGDPLPDYEKNLVGGVSTLRGYEFGYRVGDNLASLSAELRVPLTSPVYLGRFGVKGFIDAATVYASDAKLSDQHFERGVGGGAFITWAVIRMGLDVAWPVSAATHSPRWHFGLGVTF